ncbi:MAG TPA: hypothetical protein VHE35_02065 [Kofleriaceae bacterium]|nr:hypothetical protein [Kofleriaceae bacterium]
MHRPHQARALQSAGPCGGIRAGRRIALSRRAVGSRSAGGRARVVPRTAPARRRHRDDDFEVVEYQHPRLAFAISSPRAAFAGEAVHRRRPGSLHHLAFKAGSRAEVDAIHAELERMGATIVTPPCEYPEYTPPGYHAVFHDFRVLPGKTLREGPR